MKNKISISVITIILWLQFCACSKSEKQHLEPDIFARIYIETICKHPEGANTDTVSSLQAVLTEYKVSKEEFNQSIEYYKNNPALWAEVFGAVSDSLSRKQKTELSEEQKK